MKKLALFCLLSLPSIGLGESPRAAPSYQEDSLCFNSERIYFNCTIKKNKKTVSLCGDLNTSDKKLAYRYGNPLSIEMNYPQKMEAPEKNFYWIDESGGSVNMAIIKFDVAGYHYNIYDYATGGVSIWKNGKAIFEGDCETSKQAHIGSEIRNSLPKRAQRENSFE